VLLLNLGTPEGTDYWSMRRYLKEFLSDRRVIETPRWLWWPLLNLVILTSRPSRKGRDYASIWNNERNEGPLKTITRSQAEKLTTALADLGDRIVVDWGMRYGLPSTGERIEALQRPAAARAALPAILRRHHGDRVRQGLRGPGAAPLPAGRAGRGALA